MFPAREREVGERRSARRGSGRARQSRRIKGNAAPLSSRAERDPPQLLGPKRVTDKDPLTTRLLNKIRWLRRNLQELVNPSATVGNYL